MITSALIAAAALVQAAPAPGLPVATMRVPPAVAAQPSEAALAAIVARGQLLYLFDQAAWHSTDALLKTVPDPAAAGIRGWLVEPSGKVLRVTYYGLAGKEALPIYVADYANGKVKGGKLVPSAERKPLGREQQRMIDARGAAKEAGLARCVAKPFNSVVLPPQSADAPVEVYYLTPQPKANAWPMGKHYRIRVMPDGSVADSRAFSNTCLELGTAGMPKGSKPVALFVNHLLDPMPTEIHVFTALASRIPLIVQTGEVRWAVDGRAIRRVEQNKRGN